MSAAVLRTLLENRWVLHMNYNIKPAMIYTFAAYYFFPLKSIYNIGLQGKKFFAHDLVLHDHFQHYL